MTPPSTGTVAPVTPEAAGDSRKWTTSAISDGFSSLPMGVAFKMGVRSRGGRPSRGFQGARGEARGDLMAPRAGLAALEKVVCEELDVCAHARGRDGRRRR